MVSSFRKKSIAIVGTGISGCVAALKSIQNKFDVTVFDKSKNFGGILQDAIDDNNKVYFNACQYLNPDEEWYNLLKDKNFELKKFFHDKATYSDLFEEIIYEKDIAGPFIRKKINIENLLNLKKVDKNLIERLNVYPKIISNNLINWLSSINVNAEEISWNAATGLAITDSFSETILKNSKKKKRKIH